MKYPKEWPGFRYIQNGDLIPYGTLLEAVEIPYLEVPGWWARRLDDGEVWSMTLREVEPLTSEAKAVLAIARECGA